MITTHYPHQELHFLVFSWRLGHVTTSAASGWLAAVWWRVLRGNFVIPGHDLSAGIYDESRAAAGRLDDGPVVVVAVDLFRVAGCFFRVLQRDDGLISERVRYSYSVLVPASQAYLPKLPRTPRW